jgi:dUTP pyrophosphatase
MLKVKITKAHSSVVLPEYAKLGDAGCDVRYFGDQERIIHPKTTALIPTGIRVELPKEYEIQVRPRSGLAIKHSVTVLNTPGTIDSSFRGEIAVILINHGYEQFIVKPGDRIAQLVLNKVEHITWEESEELSQTERGEGGFGSSGI